MSGDQPVSGLWYGLEHVNNILTGLFVIELILRLLAARGCRITVVPAETPAEEALAHAKELDPVLPALESLAVPGAAIGDAVQVTPTDYGKVPVTGTLVAASSFELVLEREAPEVNRVMTHFPNIGFTVDPQ